MISIRDALHIIKSALPPPQSQVYDVDGALDKFLAQDIIAPEPFPRLTSSAMDGYAVRWPNTGTTSSSPVTLKIGGKAGPWYPLIAGNSGLEKQYVLVPGQCFQTGATP